MTQLPADYFNLPVAEVDPEIAEILALELNRQQRTLEMIASENFVPVSVLEAQGSVLTNKYAEGYPGRRYYGGCEFVDMAEQLAIDRAKALFGAEHANVQPHAGAQANIAVYHALLTPGDKLMGLELAHGGHLTHGMKLNASGRLYEIVTYGVDRETSVIDMDEVARIAREQRPEDDRRRLVRLLAAAGLPALPRDRRRGRRLPVRRHGALRRAGRGRVASLAGALRGRGRHDDPQDARRAALGHDPVPRGVRQEDRLGRLPGPAGRTAGARDRGQGRGAEDRRVGVVPRASGADAGGGASRSPRRCWARSTASPC